MFIRGKLKIGENEYEGAVEFSDDADVYLKQQAVTDFFTGMMATVCDDLGLPKEEEQSNIMIAKR